jgi:hypothetical protein
MHSLGHVCTCGGSEANFVVTLSAFGLGKRLRRYEIGSRGDERNAFKALEQDTEQTPPSPFHREASHAQQREQSRETEDNLWFPIRSE